MVDFVKAVNAWVRSAFGNVFLLFLILSVEEGITLLFDPKKIHRFPRN